MIPNPPSHITISPVALASSRRASASPHSHVSHNEVLPLYGHTPGKDTLYRTVESLFVEGHTNRRTVPSPTESGCFRCTRKDREPLGYVPGVALVCRAATAILGNNRDPSTYRAGDCPRAYVGNKEAGVTSVAPSRLVGRVITESCIERTCPSTRGFYFSQRPPSCSWQRGCR
jgi:hypothetical protein